MPNFLFLDNYLLNRTAVVTDMMMRTEESTRRRWSMSMTWRMTPIVMRVMMSLISAVSIQTLIMGTSQLPHYHYQPRMVATPPTSPNTPQITLRMGTCLISENIMTLSMGSSIKLWRKYGILSASQSFTPPTFPKWPPRTRVTPPQSAQK